MVARIADHEVPGSGEVLLAHAERPWIQGELPQDRPRSFVGDHRHDAPIELAHHPTPADQVGSISAR
jgi:hypothetical protein